MTAGRSARNVDWSKLEALWERVRDLPPDERAAMLASDAVDDALRDELESLLERAGSAETFFQRLGTVVPQASQADEDLPSRGAATPSDSSSGAEPDSMIGSTVGHYRIVARIGQGGMGLVYRATDLRLRREVALKLLRPRTSLDPRAKDRLLDEARAAAALDHINICTIYEVGETDEQLSFIAMAFYSGESLEAVVRRGPLPVSTALAYAMQIARGLGAAHRRAIIHRDVKPANIIVTQEGVVKLLDFGIARVLDLGAAREGVTPGTLAYMSPEQVTARPLDARTDLWSLGVVLYEMCTGVRPFGGANVAATLYAILHESPPRVSTLRQDVPSGIESIIERLLANDREQRYGDAEQLIIDLAEASNTAEVGSESAHGEAGVARPLTLAKPIVISKPATVWRMRRRSLVAVSFGVAAIVFAAVIVARFLTTSQIENPRGVTSLPRRPLDTALSKRRLAAIDLFRQGKRDVLFRTDSGRRQARDFFERALAADSAYAPAHAALALASLVPGEHSRSSIAFAEQHARSAIRLDSLLPEAHAALGRVFMFDYRFADAEAHLKRVVQLDPASDFGEFLIWLYVFMDRPGDVLTQAERLVRANPTSSNAIAELARGFLVNDRCDEALAQLERLKALQPPPARAGNIAAQCHARRHDWRNAIDAMRPVADGNPQALAYLGFMLARGGLTDEATETLDTLRARHKRGEGTAYELGVLHAGFQNHDSAFVWLQQAYDERSLRPDIMEPLFTELRQDTRFDRLRQKLRIQKR